MVLSDNKKVYNIIMEKSVHNRILEIGKELGKSKSQMVNIATKEYIQKYDRKKRRDAEKIHNKENEKSDSED